MATRQRSPNYPSIDLEEAISSVHALYGEFNRGQFDVSDAAKVWGYRGPNGLVRGRLAALRQYGLLDGQRGESPKLSRRALTFVLRNQASRDYKNALREAALSPALFREIQDTKPVASDSVLRGHLVMDRHFTDDGAERAVAFYRSTMRLAGVDSDGMTTGLEECEYRPEDEDGVDSAWSIETKPSAASAAPLNLSTDHTRVPLRLMGGTLIAAVELPSQMTEAAWKQMMTMLEALKPGYVVPEDQERPNSEANPCGT